MKDFNVVHKKFGMGEISGIEGDLITVVFSNGSIKSFHKNSFHEYFDYNNIGLRNIYNDFSLTYRSKLEIQNMLDIQRYNDALKICQQIIDEDRDDLQAWSYSALCYLKMNDFINAKKILKYFLDKMNYRALKTIDVKRLLEIEEYISSIESRANGSIVYASKGRYRSHCYNCKSNIDENMPKCVICGWYICLSCGGCRCHYNGGNILY